MSSRRTRIVVDSIFGFENVDRKALTRQRERSDNADRTAAGDDDWMIGLHVGTAYFIEV